MTDTLDLAAAADLDQDTIDIDAVLGRLVRDADAAAPTSIGFPGATDLDYRRVVTRLGGRLWNNIGNLDDPGGVAHTRVLERAAITWFANLLGMPADDRWGYATSGGTEGNRAALLAAYHRWPTARIYHTDAAHYSVRKIGREMVGAYKVVVRAGPDGEMDYDDLAAQIRRRKRWPAIVVATAGTTMTEAVDDTARIRAVLTEHGVAGHLHVDAALSGIPLALDGQLRFTDGDIDSIAISGHKFLGIPTPCGVVLIRDSVRRPAERVAYTGTVDTTVSGSRCGLAAALIWNAIAVHGREGHRWRAAEARSTAAYAVEQITAATGWRAWRWPHAFTVVLPTPPATVRARWLLATDGPVSHIVCMPGVTREQIDAFVADLADAVRTRIPHPRTPPEITTAS
ncbi:histidine decarboxylase [Micromonospora sp. WMMD1082]|uniref:histidine decarboxylase n=1 Tax=Micromonospora sp. WMMD1082 TaxID=3016104 RepID=UPI0024170ACC|nr:histidine decarboxylase [Micromonospora sp. WMMD1082]MDG4795176.1 histidine decarboxylase [Micromonospora sp. WMMD1082]